MSEQCYNRGCGQKFDPQTNTDESCRHHPGVPFFHDAYKGWSCCNRKCTDFTEFLNFQGCTLSKHSNIKPPESEKPVAKDIPDVQEIKPKHVEVPTLVRPPFNTEMNIMEPEIAPSLRAQIDKIEEPQKDSDISNNEIAIGTSCKNGGCTMSYEGPMSNEGLCLHHPGVPIFHEGLKYWSCCQRKTTNFDSFLSQEGCQEGSHVWKKDSAEDKVDCRWDYHQTGPYVVVSIYAKLYSPKNSVIKLNPIRMYCNLVFPQQNSASFVLDVELAGVIDVAASKVTMYGTKVEIKLKKAEAGSWPKLEKRVVKTEEPPKKQSDPDMPKIEAVDLSEL